MEDMAQSLGRCGLLCFLCQSPQVCNCNGNNHCGKRLSPNSCFQYECSRKKGLAGCWECDDAPCGVDMHAVDRIKIRAFITCIRQDGLPAFLAYIKRNHENGLIYHKEGIYGDYDLSTEAEVLQILRSENTF